MNTLKYVILTLVLISNIRFSMAQAVFDVRPVDRAYLCYLVVNNPFDTSVTSWQFGEVKVLGSSGYNHRVYLAPSILTDSIRHAENAAGQSSLIRSVFVSNSFVLPSTPHITFYRTLQNAPYDSDGWGGAYDIRERSEFVLQIVRDSDNVVIAVLDSVGTDTLTGIPDSARYYNAVYGTAPNSCVMDRYISSTFAGRTVHLAVSARRTSTTPYGLTYYKMHQFIPFSRYYGANCSYTLAKTDSASNALWKERYDSIVVYADSMWAADCTLPLTFAWQDSTQADSFYTRYYTKSIDSVYGLTYTPTACGGMGKLAGKKTSATIPQLPFAMSPNPSSSGEAITLVVPTLAGGTVKGLHVSDVLGRDMTPLIREWNRIGGNAISFDASTLPSGRYVVTVEYGDRHSSRILVVRK